MCVHSPRLSAQGQEGRGVDSGVDSGWTGPAAHVSGFPAGSSIAGGVPSPRQTEEHLPPLVRGVFLPGQVENAKEGVMGG